MSRRRPSALRKPCSFEPFDLFLGLATVALAAAVKPSSELRIALVLIAALALLWPAARHHRGERHRGERRRTRLIVCLALASMTFAVSGRLPDFVTTWKVRVWNVYHYYVGAKYFPELGYTDLYDATLSADREGANTWRRILRVRNLHTYAIEDRRFRIRAYQSQGRENFEPERWQSFSRDVAALSGQLPPDSWQGILTDRGYNGTPVWTVLGGGLASLVPADHRLGLKLICSLDLLFLAATLGLIWKTFGLRPAALVLLLLTVTPVNRARFVGGLLQYDWFCAFAAGVCFYRRRRPVVAAGAMAYAALTRVFPLFFVLAGAIPALDHWRRTGRRPHRQLRFLTAFGVWCALGFIVSLANGRGIGGWNEFATAISLHHEHHLFGQARVGLERISTYDLKNLAGPHNVTEARRRVIFERQRPLYALAAAALLLFFLITVRRQRTWDAQLLGLVPVFALLVTSRYYWSYLALLPLMGGRRGPPEMRSRWLAAGQLVVFAGYYAVDSRGIEPLAAYGVLNVLLAGFMIFMLAVCLRGTRAHLDPM